MNRKQRRAAAHKERKLARKAGFSQSAQTVSPTPVAELDGIPEPGAAGPFPSFAELTNTAAAQPQPAKPISQARLLANRANAQLSTGPTMAGRAISSQNRTTHGLARHNGAFKLLPSEDPNGFEALKQSLAAEHQPETETESILVNTMAESHWLANRAQTLQATCFSEQTGELTNEKLFSLYLRYQTTHTRAFHKSLNDLLKLRAERRKAELGFEAQNRKTDELRIKNEKHEMKKQTHYWDVLRKDAQAVAQISQNASRRGQAILENPGFKAQFAGELAQHGLKEHTCLGAAVATAA